MRARRTRTGRGCAIAAGLCFGLSVIHAEAADSGVWNTELNTVTYSVLVDPVELGPEYRTSTQVDLSQFNAAVAATQDGGNASQYSLTKVVLGLDSTVYGSFTFQNNGVATVHPYYDYAGYSRLEYGSYSTANETYSSGYNLGNVATGVQVSRTINNAGSGAVSSPDITSGLSGFTGTDTAATTLYFPVSGSFSSGGVDWTSTVAVQGKATVSVTYYYDYATPVPEPTSLALIGLGVAVVALRRRRAL